MTELIEKQHYLATTKGQIYVKEWQPASTTGTLAPIVLFHDSLGCVALWRDFPKHLAIATQRRIIAYDRLGYGKSDAFSGQLDNQFVFVESQGIFRELYEGLALDQFIALGHSVGGGMAASCAAVYPETCLGLVTVAAQAMVEDKTVAGVNKAKAHFSVPEQFARLEKFHGSKARWVLDAWTETWLSVQFRDWSLSRVLSQISCPVLAIHGEQDEYGTRRHPELITEQVVGKATLALIPDCGHVPHREQPAFFMDWLIPFLEML